uniref:Retrovirus-related Env polyprotein from transposon gypsy n=1 Tax=Bactrocera dorsalis TaxID=27457 RepID=A0A034VTJ4_BACDO
MLLNLKAQCNVKEESNEEIIEINEGNILINGKNKINNETITGTYLVQFKENIKLNNITFHNQNEEIKKYILSQEENNIKILDILESNSKYKFNNIEKLHKFIIPYEEHPIQNIFVTLIIICILATTIYLSFKLYYAILKCKTLKLKENQQKRYEQILKAQGLEHLIKKDAITSV